MGYRIGVDVGGTFTDFVLADSDTGVVVSYKEPSTPSDPSLAVEKGLGALLELGGVPAGDVELLVHGTTLGLNAVLQRRGAPCVLVVSRGNRDVLELARCRMPSPYNFSLPRDEPLLPRDRVLEIDARCDARGEIIARPTEADYDRVAAAIRECGADAVAVSLLNAYLNPALELDVATALEERVPGAHVTPSTRVWPEIREYERSMLAVMNAYVHPMMDAYYARLEQRLRAAGLSADLYITASNGGTLSVASARERPVDTLLSGPASGVVAACQLAEALGRSGMVSIDMGGTSCDMAVAQGGAPQLTTRAHVGEFPVIAPVVDVSAIGAGGGSVVWVDSQGVLKVGPHSAGADPGPVCYGRGGTRPTITDCFLLTGLVDPDAFLGGRMHLDREAAAAALAALGEAIGYAGEDAAVRTADAAIRVATAMMSTELYKELAQRGVDPRGLDLVAFGGAGPTQAALLAEEARLSGIVVPLSPGTFCAYGAINSEVRRDFVRSLRRSLAAGEVTMSAIREALDQMREEALEWVSREGGRLGEPVLQARADMRYAGQAYDLGLTLPGATVSGSSVELEETFHAEHERLYGFPDRDSQVEVMAVRLSVSRALPVVTPPPLPPAEGPPEPRGERTLLLREREFVATVFHRDALLPGHAIPGPAIVEQSDTTICILPGWHGRVEIDGTLALRASERDADSEEAAT